LHHNPISRYPNHVQGAERIKKPKSKEYHQDNPSLPDINESRWIIPLTSEGKTAGIHFRFTKKSGCDAEVLPEPKPNHNLSNPVKHLPHPKVVVWIPKCCAFNGTVVLLSHPFIEHKHASKGNGLSFVAEVALSIL